MTEFNLVRRFIHVAKSAVGRFGSSASTNPIARPRLSRLALSFSVPALILLSPMVGHAFNANMQASPNPSTGNFTLTWTAPSGGYLFLQERFNGGSWSLIANNPTSPRSLTKTTPGTYGYRLGHRTQDCSFGPCIYIYDYSSVLNVTISQPTPSVPTGLTHPAFEYDGTYTVSWNSVSGATSYQLEERQWNTGNWAQIHNSGATSKSVSHSSGQWEYRVRACSSAGCSANSSSPGITVAVSGAPIYSATSVSSPTATGQTNFSAFVDPKGNGRISIPIPVPQGVNGFNLPISLAYSSGGVPAIEENGLTEDVIGHGWVLAGLPEIRSCEVNGSGYCFNGNKMVPVSGSGLTTEYRTEISSLTKITTHGTSSSNSYFKAHLPDGTELTFGSTTETRVHLPDSTGTIWTLKQAVDAFGNTINLTWYEVPEYGSNALKTIAYDGAEVHFRYISRCTSASQCDIPNSNGVGIPDTVAQPLVLDRILTKINSKWVSDYRLDSSFDSSGRLLLDRVAQCGRDESGSTTKCLPAIEFNWQVIPFSNPPSLKAIDSITDSLGNEYEFDYKVIPGNISGHTESFILPSGFPSNSLPSNVGYSSNQRAVVRHMYTPDGNSGQTIKRYYYAGTPLYDSNGRGFAGFKATRVETFDIPTFRPTSASSPTTGTDWEPHSRVTNQHRLDFPHIGAIGRTFSEVQTDPNNLGVWSMVSKTLNRFETKSFTVGSGTIQFPYLEQSVSENRELRSDGSLGYGSATKVTTDRCWRNASGATCTGTENEYPSRMEVTTQRGLNISGTDSDGNVAWGYVTTGATITGVTNTSRETVDYENSPNDWLLSAPTRRESGWGVTSITGTEEVDITPSGVSRNKPNSVKFFPSDPTYERTISFVYDSYGNVTSATDDGTDQVLSTRSNSSFLDKRYPTSHLNPVGHTSTVGYDPRFGTIDSYTDPNGEVSSITRDEFGRIEETLAPDNTKVTTTYGSCATGCAMITWAEPKMKITTSTINGTSTKVAPTQVTYIDERGLVVLTETEAFSSSDGWVRVERHYDRWGRMTKQSLPYFSVGGTAKYVENHYDYKGRNILVDRPNGESVSRYYYSDSSSGGRVNVEVKESGESRAKKLRYNRLGQLEDTTDGLGTPEAVTTAYTYWEHGALKTVHVDGTEVASITYDDARNREYLTEPNSGTTSFEYYSNHLLKLSKDAEDREISYTYDALGRLTQRLDGAGVADLEFGDPVYNTFEWDNAANGKGRLHRRKSGPVLAAPEFMETYAYDGDGRLDTVTAAIDVAGFPDNGNYVIDHNYDSSGRLNQIIYPNLTVTNVFTSRGYLQQVKKGSFILHEYTDIDAFGNTTGEDFGNGLQTARSFDSNTGELLSIQTGTSSLPRSVQDLEYDWRSDGLLFKRHDKLGTTSTSDDLMEQFGYDDLGRLTSASTPKTSRDLTYTYDDFGNLGSKLSDISGDLDVTNYTYPTSTQPHRLGSVLINGINNSIEHYSTGEIKWYDANTGDDTYLRYEQSGNLDRIVVGNSVDDTTPTAKDEFWYGPNGQRFLRKASWMDGSTLKSSWTLYLQGGRFQEVHPVHDAGVSYRQKVMVTDSVSHRYKKTPSSSATGIEYMHRDHIGSVTSFTIASSSIARETDFDPFGRQRGKGWDRDASTSEIEGFAEDEDTYIQRGFTDHEMLNRTGFVHMNGRVYDPRIGRFVQPDPLVADPTIGDAYNRYSYVMNSPMSFTDPSGYLLRATEEGGGGDPILPLP